MQMLKILETKSKCDSPATRLHCEAVATVKDYFRCEAKLLEVIARIEATKAYYEFELTTLEQYCVELL
ncbi:MAG: hypothetical protein V4736_05335, partial [Bdellovibrionota bacterium]